MLRDKFPMDIQVIDPGTGDKFWFRYVENEDEVKNIQRLRFEIIEKREL